MIWWQGFSWEAFTTLVVGVAAVIGAVWVGLRQVEILDRQTKIQESMLKATLYERREEILTCTRRLVTATINENVTQNMRDDFEIALAKAKYVFDSKVYTTLGKIRDLSELMEMCADYKETGPDGRTVINRAGEAHYQKLGIEMCDLGNGLGELFKEMSLIEK